jgi:hypothetical protein
VKIDLRRSEQSEKLCTSIRIERTGDDAGEVGRVVELDVKRTTQLAVRLETV